MKLENAMRLPVPADEAWKVLLDIERIAPCVPGATLTSHEGDTFQGTVKVKLGPISLSYKGTVSFVSLDEAARVAVLEAGGRETRGGGTAKAVVTCRLVEDGEATDVLVETDLAITGKPAQFGRSTLADVSTTLIGQFAGNLANEIAPGPPTAEVSASSAPSTAEGGAQEETRPPAPDGATTATAAAAAATATAATAATAPRAAAEPIDLLQVAGGGMLGRLKRFGPIAAVTALVAFLLNRLRRRRHPRTHF